MARQLIECVPNFSEGRRKDVIEELIETFTRCPSFEMKASLLKKEGKSIPCLTKCKNGQWKQKGRFSKPSYDAS